MNFFIALLNLPEKLYSYARMSTRDALFKSTKEKTFEFEENLPNLPVPSLAKTLEIYLDSVRAVVSEEEYKTTEVLVRNFENGIGVKLQELLLKRAEERKNWVSLCYAWIHFAIDIFLYTLICTPCILVSFVLQIIDYYDKFKTR